jgi:hypothetical protein
MKHSKPANVQSSSCISISHVAAIPMLILICAFFSSYAGSAGSTTGGETVSNLGPNGDMYTSNWRDGNCTATRTWNALADSFSFTWNSAGGNDQIGRIGKGCNSPGYVNVKVDDVKSPCIMSETANMKSLNTSGGWYIFCIYGWTGTADNFGARHNEFYVFFQSTYNPAPGQNGYISIGSVTIDGVQFDCVKNLNMPWDNTRNQYMAIPKSGTWGGAAKAAPWSGNASVDLKKILAYFRANGLENEYVVEITWAIEGYSGSSGSIQMSNMVIPDIKASTATALKLVMPVAYPSLQASTSLFSLNGRMVPTAFIVQHEAISVPGIFVNDKGVKVWHVGASKD